MCFICYDEGYLVKIPCNNCNLFIHPLCLEKLIENFGFVCKVCKSNYNLSLEQIIIDPIISYNNEINQVLINRRIIIKRLQICIIIFFIIFILFLIAYFYIRIFN